MNARDLLPHATAAELLPWLVNDSLAEDEKQAVIEHARACVICRRELNELERLRDSIAQASASPTPAPDMRNINARIDALLSRQNRFRDLLAKAGDFFKQPWRIAFAAQSVLLVVLVGVLLWPQPEDREFTVLTHPDALPDGHYLRLVFTPDLAPAELSRLLDQFELDVVDGPSLRGVYTLGLKNSSASEERDRLLVILQADPRILFAQAVVRNSAP